MNPISVQTLKALKDIKLGLVGHKYEFPVAAWRATSINEFSKHPRCTPCAQEISFLKDRRRSPSPVTRPLALQLIERPIHESPNLILQLIHKRSLVDASIMLGEMFRQTIREAGHEEERSLLNLKHGRQLKHLLAAKMDVQESRVEIFQFRPYQRGLQRVIRPYNDVIHVSEHLFQGTCERKIVFSHKNFQFIHAPYPLTNLATSFTRFAEQMAIARFAHTTLYNFLLRLPSMQGEYELVF